MLRDDGDKVVPLGIYRTIASGFEELTKRYERSAIYYTEIKINK